MIWLVYTIVEDKQNFWSIGALGKFLANRFRSGYNAFMAVTIQELGLDRMSREERLALAEEIWESVARETEQEATPASQRAELERRLADSIARPNATTPWEIVKADAIARRGL